MKVCLEHRNHIFYVEEQTTDKQMEIEKSAEICLNEEKKTRDAHNRRAQIKCIYNQATSHTFCNNQKSFSMKCIESMHMNVDDGGKWIKRWYNGGYFTWMLYNKDDRMKTNANEIGKRQQKFAFEKEMLSLAMEKANITCTI